MPASIPLLPPRFFPKPGRPFLETLLNRATGFIVALDRMRPIWSLGRLRYIRDPCKLL
jgi:hypothetical protein